MIVKIGSLDLRDARLLLPSPSMAFSGHDDENRPKWTSEAPFRLQKEIQVRNDKLRKENN